MWPAPRCNQAATCCACFWRRAAMAPGNQTEYFSRGSCVPRGSVSPQGCCQHLRVLFQWKPICERSARMRSAGGSGNVIQTHLPTTSASSYCAGIQRLSFSSTFSTERVRLKSRSAKFTYGFTGAFWVTVSAFPVPFPMSLQMPVRFLTTARFSSGALSCSCCLSCFVCWFSWFFFLISAARFRTLALHLLKPSCHGGAWEGSSEGTTLWPPDQKRAGEGER